MTTQLSNISNIIPNVIRFEPIDPDTLIYSNDEEDDEHIQVILEKHSRDTQLKTSSNSGSTSENRATKSRRVKQVSRKLTLSFVFQTNLKQEYQGEEIYFFQVLIIDSSNTEAPSLLSSLS